MSEVYYVLLRGMCKDFLKQTNAIYFPCAVFLLAKFNNLSLQKLKPQSSQKIEKPKSSCKRFCFWFSNAKSLRSTFLIDQTQQVSKLYHFKKVKTKKNNLVLLTNKKTLRKEMKCIKTVKINRKSTS